METAFENPFSFEMFVALLFYIKTQNFFLSGNLILPLFPLIINLLNTIGVSEKTMRHISVAFNHKQEMLQDPYM